eukprot:6204439-Pleurochrysis_carterae.AAC.2
MCEQRQLAKRPARGAVAPARTHRRPRATDAGAKKLRGALWPFARARDQLAQGELNGRSDGRNRAGCWEGDGGGASLQTPRAEKAGVASGA